MKTENLTKVEAMQEWINGHKIKENSGWIQWREKDEFYEMHEKINNGKKVKSKEVPLFCGSNYSIIEIEKENLTIDEAVSYLKEDCSHTSKDNKVSISRPEDGGYEGYKWARKTITWPDCENGDGFLWLDLAKRNNWIIEKVPEWDY